MYRMIRNDIYIDKNGEIDVDYFNQSHGGISIRPGKGSTSQADMFAAKPYIAEDKLLNGHSVYSVYTFSNDYQLDIFRKIKKGLMDPDLYDEWLDVTARYVWHQIVKLNRPDIIVTPQSSSSLVVDFAEKVSDYANVEFLPHAFIKNPVDDIIIKCPEGVNAPDRALAQAQKVLDYIKQTGKFEAKSVPKQLLKFFRNLYRNDEEYVDLLKGKKVAVIDDSMTSRATMFNIFDVCDYVYEASDSYGITIFKHMSTRK